MHLTTLWRCGAALALCATAGAASAADVAPSMLVIERYAAERGDANAQYFMGEHHELGDSGVEKDLGKALALYAKAADQQHAPAQYKLGRFHEQGLGGLGPDLAKAREWYGLAARNGSDVARQRLADLDEASSRANEERRRKEQEEALARDRRRAEREAELQRRAAEQKRLAERQALRTAPVAPPAVTVKKSTPAFDAAQLLEHVAGKRWHQAGGDAEFLPGTDMSCLKTNLSEITCFSKERRRQVADRHATFSLKAVLGNFSEQGGFDVSYTYNVTRLEAAAGTAPDDEYGLLAAEGWQSPGQSAHCRLRGQGWIECRGPRDRTWEYRAR